MAIPASQHYYETGCQCCDYEDTIYPSPLFFFIWNEFDPVVLDRVLSVYPDALSDKSSLYYAKLYGIAEDGGRLLAHDTLLWLSSRVDASFDTAEALLTYFKMTEDEMAYDILPEEFNQVALVLLSKSPRFSPSNKESCRLLDRLLAWKVGDARPELWKTMLSKLPKECRVLNMTEHLCHDFSEDGRVEPWSLDEANLQLVKGSLSEITELKFELACIDDDDYLVQFLQTMAFCTTLSKLTLEIGTNVGSVRNSMPLLNAITGLLEQLHPSTLLNIVLYEPSNREPWHDDSWWDGFEKEMGREIDLNYDLVNDKSIDRLLGALAKASCPSPRLTNISVYLGVIACEKLAQLSQFSSSLNLSLEQPFPVYSDRLCKLWNIKCPNSKACQLLSDKAFRSLYSTANVHGLRIGDASIISAACQAPKLVQLRLGDSIWIGPGADITKALVALLKLGTLERLQVESSKKIQLSSFCESVKQSNVERLELAGMDFCVEDGRSVSEWFLEMVGKSIHKQLTFLSLSSHRGYHFINDGAGALYRSLYGNKQFLDSPEVSKIQYLLWLNKFGRGKLGRCDANVRVLVECLEQAISVNMRILMRDTNRWCGLLNDSGGKAKTSILCDLLRESPHLWASSAGSKTTASPSRGQKRKVSRLERD